MSMQVDQTQLGAIHASTSFQAFRVVTVGDEEKRFPGRLEAAHVLAVLGSEHERVRPELAASTQDGREAAFGSNGIRRFSLSLVV